MKRLLFTLIGCVVAVLSVSAQEDPDWSWTDNAPDKYLPKMTQVIISSDSPCNQGGEAFKDFIPRFRKDKVFRDSRVKIDDEMFRGMFEMLAYWNNGNGYALLKAHKMNQRCDKSFGTWYNVSADEVCFTHQDVLPCVDAGGSSLHIRFQRIDGKWYCTACAAAG